VVRQGQPGGHLRGQELELLADPHETVDRRAAREKIVPLEQCPEARRLRSAGIGEVGVVAVEERVEDVLADLLRELQAAENGPLVDETNRLVDLFGFCGNQCSSVLPSTG